MRPLTATLNELLVLGEEIVARPMLDARFIRGRLDELATEVRHADRLPAESIRTTRAALMFVIAVEEYRAAAAKECSGRWLMIAGALLPLLREEAFQALRNEREVSDQ